MSIVRMIIKEAAGRGLNAAGAIKSKSNMYEGSSGNAISGRLLGNKSEKTGNSVLDNQSESGDESTPETKNSSSNVATEGTSDTTADVGSGDLSSREDIGAGTSDAKAKTEIKSVSFRYQPVEGGRIRGMLKDVNLADAMKPKTPNMSTGGGGMPAAGGAGVGGESADVADSADAADAADAADGADAMG